MKKLGIEIHGASYEPTVGVTVTGLERGLKIDFGELNRFLARRSPTGAVWSTARREPDVPEFVSGIGRDGVLNGEPLEVIINNTGNGFSGVCGRARIPRPGHADFAAAARYGNNVDLRGGGRFSGRMTAPMCVAGGIVLQLLAKKGISVFSHIYSVAGICDRPFAPCPADREAYVTQPDFPVLDSDAGKRMIETIAAAKAENDSVGGIAEVAVTGLSAGCGGELFDGLEGIISGYVFAVPAIKGIEFGNGFGCTLLRGSENNDAYAFENGRAVTVTNNCGGILGGISDGMPVIFRAAVKPTPSVGVPQISVNLETGERVTLENTGNNDACIVPRVLPALESAAAFAVYEVI